MGKIKRRSYRLARRGRILFVSGLLAMLPMVVTFYLVWWIGAGVDMALRRVLPETVEHIPGLGILTALVLILLAGLWVNLWLGQRLLDLADYLLNRIPVVRAVYGSTRDLLDLVTHSRQQEFNQVVTLDIGGMRMFGFVTREDLEGLPEGVAEPGMVAIYLPMAYQIGGYTILVQRDRLHAVDMSLQSALRFILTAGVSKETMENGTASDRMAEQTRVLTERQKDKLRQDGGTKPPEIGDGI